VLATLPLTAGERRDLGFGEVMLWDTRRPFHYVRWTPDGRLLLGGADRPLRAGASRAAAFKAAIRDLTGYSHGLFPTLTGVEFSHAWEGVFATTSDTLPFVGANAAIRGTHSR
jgi:glycine/D-amino acid oxidase-like deaminating enzyme